MRPVFPFVLLDLDGTLYLDERLFDGAADFLRAIRSRGGTYRFLTNNSSRGAESYVEKLRRLGVEAENGSSDITATDDKDVNAQVDVSIVALTTDADSRVTSAIADMAEPALTVVSDGSVTAPDLVKTKLELGEDYGMRGASALGKEWYEHSEGFCDALKGKTRTEIAGLSGGDADLKALCTIDITDLQKAALDALS